MLKKMLTIYKTVGVFTDLMTSVAMLVAALISSINCYILLTGEGINRPFWRELFLVAWGIFAIIVYWKGKNTMDIEVAEWLIDEKKDIQD